MRSRTRQPLGQARVRGGSSLAVNLIAAFHATRDGAIRSAFQPWVNNSTSPSASKATFYWRGQRYAAQSGGLSSDGWGIRLNRTLGVNSSFLSFAVLVYFPSVPNGSISICQNLGGDFFAMGFHNRGGTATNEFNVSMRGASGTYFDVATGETALKPRFAVGRLRADDRLELWVDGVYVGYDAHTRGGYNTFYNAPTYVSAIATGNAQIAVGYAWDRWVSDSEIQALSRDPFLLFDAGDSLIETSGGVQVSYQYARPSSDIVTTGWSEVV